MTWDLGPGAGGWGPEAGGWGLEAGGWRLEAGGWRLGAGGWRLEAGGWDSPCGQHQSTTAISKKTPPDIIKSRLGGHFQLYEETFSHRCHTHQKTTGEDTDNSIHEGRHQCRCDISNEGDTLNWHHQMVR